MARSVLVVGGERHIQRLVQVNLERQGYEVYMARTLAEARLRIDARCPDFVVVDVLDPFDAAWDFLYGLKRDPATRHVRIVLLSPCAPDADVLRGWRGGTPDMRFFEDEQDDEDETPQ